MLPRADLVLYDRDGQLIAVAEVKTKFGTSRDWAAQLRRNVLAHGRFHNVDFFLLVTPDTLYIWKEAGVEPIASPPTYAIDARPILKPYFETAHIDPNLVNGSAFELVVGAWLADLTRSEKEPEKLYEKESWLAESGLLKAIRNGRIGYEAAA